MFLAHKASPLFLRRFYPQASIKLRCFPRKFYVSASLNTIAAAAASGSTVLGAVSSAITQLDVTAVAIASGACLSTKVDLWPKVEEQQGSFTVEGIDVTGYPIFSETKAGAKGYCICKRAHQGQFRKTGDPYLSHCIHTGRILAMLIPSTGLRAVDTVVAGILHMWLMIHVKVCSA
ncbi:ADP-ribosylation factor family protein [Hibiscus syriacus]|uniref:ADP-ribosylation factor family protein n=1 Tax=Hibiscus syriacus TaxID=106335 RepID=A0A6A2XP14_HIBSY|nr:ADP-ribosylation factor family protein [Hibiscus syriacus]